MYNILTQTTIASSGLKVDQKYCSHDKADRSSPYMYEELIQDQNCLEIIKQFTQAAHGQILMDSK
jgi:hypothetical protein